MKPLRLKAHNFHPKLLFQKPMLRQIEWRLQNGPITKGGVLPVTLYFIFLENFFQFYNILNRVSFMYQWPKCPYSYFSQALEFNFGCFFPVSILKYVRNWNDYNLKYVKNIFACLFSVHSVIILSRYEQICLMRLRFDRYFFFFFFFFFL